MNQISNPQVDLLPGLPGVTDLTPMTALLTFVKAVLVKQDVIDWVHVGATLTLGELSWLDLSRTEGPFSRPY